MGFKCSLTSLCVDRKDCRYCSYPMKIFDKSSYKKIKLIEVIQDYKSNLESF